MYSSLLLFRKNIEESKQISSIYGYLKNQIKSPVSFDDLLRSQIVYSVSAFDKLMHDIIRVGMVEIFSGKRTPTKKYLSEGISMIDYMQLTSAIPGAIPPKEYLYEQMVFKKLKTISYQDPRNIADGLSHIWDEAHKWQTIAAGLGMDEEDVRKRMKLIVDRRNSIVHEADIDPSVGIKYSINQKEADAVTSFIERCGEEIVKNVSLPP
jgi:hypothetical protein